MATDARGHTVPAGSDVFDPQGSAVALGLSINDVIMAANATDRASKVAAIVPAPTTARPAFVWQSDTEVVWRHNGTDDQVIARAGAGVLGVASVTASQSITGSTATDLTGLSKDVTVGTGRRLRISFTSDNHGSGAADVFAYNIVDGTTFLRAFTVPANSANVADATYTASGNVIVDNLSAGSHTFKLQLQHIVGSGTCWMAATTSAPTTLLIEDLGPAS